MFEAVVQKIVHNQIEAGSIEESEKEVYLYGYQMLIEFCINIFVSVLIAFTFRAFVEVIIFTITFLLIRGYVGGYHAKTSLGCFCWSASILIGSVVMVKIVGGQEWWQWLFLLESIAMPCVFKESPVPTANKPITDNERIHFKKMVKQIYILELAVELLLLLLGLREYALSILAVHVVLFIMVIAEFLQKNENK